MSTPRIETSDRRLPPAKQRAFTLVEVLVVVMIVAISGAVVVPHMLRGGQLGLQAAARAVIADVLFAQNDAVASQAVRQVVFDADENRYRLTDGGGTTISANWLAGSEAGQNYIIDFDEDNRFRGIRVENVNFGGGSTLAFDDLGSPASGGTFELTTGDFRYRVTVAAFTGQVTVAPVAGE